MDPQCSASVSPGGSPTSSTPNPPHAACSSLCLPGLQGSRLICWGWESGLVPNVFLHQLSPIGLRRPIDSDSGSLNQRRSSGRLLGLPGVTQARGVFTPRRRWERTDDLASASAAPAAGLGPRRWPGSQQGGGRPGRRYETRSCAQARARTQLRPRLGTVGGENRPFRGKAPFCSPFWSPAG